jgi:hypothetical protein
LLQKRRGKVFSYTTNELIDALNVEFASLPRSPSNLVDELTKLFSDGGNWLVPIVPRSTVDAAIIYDQLKTSKSLGSIVSFIPLPQYFEKITKDTYSSADVDYAHMNELVQAKSPKLGFHGIAPKLLGKEMPREAIGAIKELDLEVASIRTAVIESLGEAPGILASALCGGAVYSLVTSSISPDPVTGAAGFASGFLAVLGIGVSSDTVKNLAERLFERLRRRGEHKDQLYSLSAPWNAKILNPSSFSSFCLSRIS